MISPRESPKVASRPAESAATAVSGRPDDAREQQRQALRIAECVRRDVRFLPFQVMRAIYAKEGLL